MSITTQQAFRVVRPSAGIVSQHRTLSGAERSLQRQRRGARAQGGYSQDYIEQRGEDGQFRRLARMA